MPALDRHVPAAVLERLGDGYRARWGATIALHALDGTPRGGSGADPCPRTALAIAEAQRWGEPVVVERGGEFIWAVPVHCNQQLLGGVVASLPEAALFPVGSGRARLDMRAACRDLLERATADNLVNAAGLAEARAMHLRERERAEAIHLSKTEGSRDVLEEYRRAEPELLRAVRAGDRKAARAILNRVLVAIYHRAGDRLALSKSLLMELVVVLCRAGIESGGLPEELLGTNWDLLLALKEAGDEEAITRWLVTSLERIMDAIARHGGEPSDVLLREAIERMRQRAHEDLDRDGIAVEVGLAPAALSRLLMRRYGQGFTGVLNQMRIDRAKRLLASEDDSLLQVALSCGFDDPSYFTKVFRRHEGMTPSEYRKRMLAG